MGKTRSLIAITFVCGLIAFQAQAADPVGATLGTEGEWVHGWAMDADNPSAKVQLHFYVDASKGNAGSMLGQASARYDHDSLDGTDRQGHAFFFRIPESVRDGKPHTLQAHGLNVGPGNNAPLGKPVTFQLDPDPSRVAPDDSTPLALDPTPDVWVCKADPWILGESDDWPFGQEHVDVLALYVDQVKKAPIEKLRRLVEVLEKHDIQIAIELAGLVDWEAKSRGQSGERSFACEAAKVKRLTDPVDQGGAGGTIAFLNVDGPFRRSVYPNGKNAGYHTIDSAGDELVDSLNLWRERYPNIQFNLLTNFFNWGWRGGPAYNNFQLPNGVEGWGDYLPVLQTALRKTSEAGIEINGLTIDAPYDYLIDRHVSNQPYEVKGEDWMTRVRDLEDVGRAAGLQVRLIINSERGGNKKRGSAERYYNDTMWFIEDYVAAGGRPDAYIVQSWYHHPTEWLPESKPYTMMHLVRSVVRKLGKGVVR